MHGIGHAPAPQPPPPHPRRLGAQRRLPGDVRRRRVHRAVGRVPRPALAELVPIGVGVTVYGAAYALVHDVYIHRRLRWFGDRRRRACSTGSPTPTRCTTARRRALRDARADRPGASGAVTAASGSRPSHVPGWRRARSGRTAPRRTSARRACGARRRGGAADAAKARIASRSAPQAERAQPADRQLADAGDGEQPGRPLQLGADGRSGGAERPPRAAARTSARVRTAIGPSSAPGAQTVEHVDAAPRPVPADQPAAGRATCSVGRRPALGDRRAVEERVEVAPRRSQTANSAVRRRSADGPVSAPRPVPSRRQNAQARRRAGGAGGRWRGGSWP